MFHFTYQLDFYILNYCNIFDLNNKYYGKSVQKNTQQRQ